MSLKDELKEFLSSEELKKLNTFRSIIIKW